MGLIKPKKGIDDTHVCPPAFVFDNYETTYKSGLSDGIQFNNGMVFSSYTHEGVTAVIAFLFVDGVPSLLFETPGYFTYTLNEGSVSFKITKEGEYPGKRITCREKMSWE